MLQGNPSYVMRLFEMDTDKRIAPIIRTTNMLVITLKSVLAVETQN